MAKNTRRDREAKIRRLKEEAKTKETPEERAEAKRLPATTKFEDRIKASVGTVMAVSGTFIDLLIEFLMALFASSEPDAARITRRLARPNRWHRACMVMNVYRDAEGDLTKRESRRMVAAVILEARENPRDTQKMVQEGLDEIQRLKALEAGS